MYRFTEEEMQKINNSLSSPSKMEPSETSLSNTDEDRYSTKDAFGRRTSSMKQRFMRYMEQPSDEYKGMSFEEKDKVDREKHPFLQSDVLSNIPIDVPAAITRTIGGSGVAMLGKCAGMGL